MSSTNLKRIRRIASGVFVAATVAVAGLAAELADGSSSSSHAATTREPTAADAPRSASPFSPAAPRPETVVPVARDDRVVPNAAPAPPPVPALPQPTAEAAQPAACGSNSDPAVNGESDGWKPTAPLRHAHTTPHTSPHAHTAAT